MTSCVQHSRCLPLGRPEAVEQALAGIKRAPSEVLAITGSQQQVLKKDSYPLSHVDECLDLVAGSSWFGSLPWT